MDLTLGMSVTPRTRALFDGSVRPAGIQLRKSIRHGTRQYGAPAIEPFCRAKLRVANALRRFIPARMRGVKLRLLPVFLARRFRHRCMFCAVASPVTHPSELKEKRVTVHRYNSTTAVWVRGLLQNEYRVGPEAMEWHVAEPDVGEEALRPAPEGVMVKLIPVPRTREHAIQMVEDGKIARPWNRMRAWQKTLDCAAC
jgi:hypothetical protein